MNKNALNINQKHLPILKSVEKTTQRARRQPKEHPKDAHMVQRCIKNSPKTPKRHPKAIPKPVQNTNPRLKCYFPQNVSKTHACACFRANLKTCLSKGTGSAFKGGEFAKHVSTSVRTSMRRRVRNT